MTKQYVEFENDENYESEGEISVLSSISSYTDKDTQGSVASEPLSPIGIRRARVSSAEYSLISASPSIDTMKRLKSPANGPVTSSELTILSKKKENSSVSIIDKKSIEPEEIEITSKRTWNFENLNLTNNYLTHLYPILIVLGKADRIIK